MKKDWNALLAAMGFDAAQVTAIRALEGIDADLEIFADRFLKPGAPGEIEVREGHGAVQGEGSNSKGRSSSTDLRGEQCFQTSGGEVERTSVAAPIAAMRFSSSRPAERKSIT